MSDALSRARAISASNLPDRIRWEQLLWLLSPGVDENARCCRREWASALSKAIKSSVLLVDKNERHIPGGVVSREWLRLEPYRLKDRIEVDVSIKKDEFVNYLRRAEIKQNDLSREMQAWILSGERQSTETVMPNDNAQKLLSKLSPFPDRLSIFEVAREMSGDAREQAQLRERMLTAAKNGDLVVYGNPEGWDWTESDSIPFEKACPFPDAEDHEHSPGFGVGFLGGDFRYSAGRPGDACLISGDDFAKWLTKVGCSSSLLPLRLREWAFPSEKVGLLVCVPSDELIGISCSASPEVDTVYSVGDFRESIAAAKLENKRLFEECKYSELKHDQFDALLDACQFLSYDPSRLHDGTKKAIDKWVSVHRKNFFPRDNSFREAWESATKFKIIAHMRKAAVNRQKTTGSAAPVIKIPANRK